MICFCYLFLPKNLSCPTGKYETLWIIYAENVVFISGQWNIDWLNLS